MYFNLLIINESPGRRNLLAKMANDQESLSAVGCHLNNAFVTAIEALKDGLFFDIVVSDFFIKTDFGLYLADTLAELYAPLKTNKSITALTIPQFVYFLALDPVTRKPLDAFKRISEPAIIKNQWEERPIFAFAS